MKKLLFCFLLFLLPSLVQAQLGNRYFHCDTLQINNVIARDTTWTTAWEIATIFADTVNVDLKVGAPDYGDWGSRNTFFLEQGMALSIGPTPTLKRLWARARNGTGILYIIGYKKVRQY